MALFLTLLDRFKNHIFYERKRMKKLALFLTDVKKYTGCPRTGGSNLECVFLDGNEGKKRLEKYSGCNSFSYELIKLTNRDRSNFSFMRKLSTFPQLPSNV
jgi:hypothetical protein